MPDRSLDDLVPEFKAQVEALTAALAAQGFTLVPYFTLRTPQEQATLWRQSRAESVIDAEIAYLNSMGAQWLSRVLLTTPASSGPWATNATPGNSWHQWAEACDFYWQTATGIQWADGDGYKALATEAAALGLTSGRGFSHPDIDHVQLRPQGAPSDLYSWPEIDAKMKAKFDTIGA